MTLAKMLGWAGPSAIVCVAAIKVFGPVGHQFATSFTELANAIATSGR